MCWKAAVYSIESWYRFLNSEIIAVNYLYIVLKCCCLHHLALAILIFS